MRIFDYLTVNHQEEQPSWLANYNVGDILNISDFLKSRTVYYPGCGSDNHAIQVFSESRSCHCFLYADYMFDVGSVSEIFANENFIPGYKLLSITSVDESSFKSFLKIRKRKKRNSAKEFSGLLGIFERLGAGNICAGARRIAVLFLIDDGIELYRDIYCLAHGIQPPFAALIQDHGFGGNYSKFGRGGKLCEIAQEYRVFPSFMLVGGENNAWPSYTNMRFDFVVGGQHNNERLLFIKE